MHTVQVPPAAVQHIHLHCLLAKLLSARGRLIAQVSSSYSVCQYLQGLPGRHLHHSHQLHWSLHLLVCSKPSIFQCSCTCMDNSLQISSKQAAGPCGLDQTHYSNTSALHAGHSFALYSTDVDFIKRMRTGLDMAQQQIQSMSISQIKLAVKQLVERIIPLSDEAKAAMQHQLILNSLLMGRVMYVNCKFLNRYSNVLHARDGLSLSSSRAEACKIAGLQLSAAELTQSFHAKVSLVGVLMSRSKVEAYDQGVLLFGWFIRNGLSHSPHRQPQKKWLSIRDVQPGKPNDHLHLQIPISDFQQIMLRSESCIQDASERERAVKTLPPHGAMPGQTTLPCHVER